MKIVHLALQAPYNEGWGYQENLLTKYQVRLGHEVTLVTTTLENQTGGTFGQVMPCDYMSPDGFRVIRLAAVQYFPQKLSRIFTRYDIKKLLKEIEPDFIMVHGLGNLSVKQIIQYRKKMNPHCIIIADNHLDYNIGAGMLRKSLFGRMYNWVLRRHNKKMQKYYSTVYGVTPWRCEFANEVFGIAESKLDVLPAGADDEKIDFANRKAITASIRKKHNIDPEDFLVVTGGKIDQKKNIHLLMQAVSQMPNMNIKLIVFGDPAKDIEEVFNQYAQHQNIRHIGWIPAEETYNYFLGADLVFFPGQHSVMWEQTVACGTPCVFKHYHAMHHCDIGGNCSFLYEDSVEAIQQLLHEIMQPENYAQMLRIARSVDSRQFLYSQLAQKSLEAVGGN